MAPLKGTVNPAKALLRAEVTAKITKLSCKEKARQSNNVYQKIINHPVYKSSERIAMYMNTENEVDTSNLIEEARSRGATPFVPQYAGGHMKMLRILHGDEAKMAVTKHGIQQHANGEVREDAFETGGLDLVITPGIAFTRCGKRLGHGGGYYDRYICALLQRHVEQPGFTKPRLVAIAFNEQIVDDIPMEETDVPVEIVVTADCN